VKGPVDIFRLNRTGKVRPKPIFCQKLQHLSYGGTLDQCFVLKLCANFVPIVRGTVGDFVDIGGCCGNVEKDVVRFDLVLSC